MNKNNKVYANNIDKNIKNNNNVFYSNEQEIFIDDDISVEKKIDDIFNSKSYIYKANVLIKTINESFQTTIIGKNSSNLITNKNELIPISTIKDIKKM